MKELLLGVVLLVLLGVGGFFYRNAMEAPAGVPIACTEEAKLCPDGSAVSRIGPTCSFAPCPPPNMELDTTPTFIAAVPDGYLVNVHPNVDRALGGDMTIIHEFKKPASGSVAHTITVHQHGVDPEDREVVDVEDNIVRDTVFYPADMPAESISDFKQVTLGGRIFYTAVIERFEAIVHSVYYLPIQASPGHMNLYSFEIVEHDVTDWMEPSLNVEELPEHKALLNMLETLQGA